MEVYTALFKKHLFSKPSSQLSRDEILATLVDILGYVKGVPMVQKATFRATLEGRMERIAAPFSYIADKSTKVGGNGPLIKEVVSKELTLSLWPSVLPWETTRGLSLVPDKSIRGCNGRNRNEDHINDSLLKSSYEPASGVSQAEQGSEYNDPLAFVTKKDKTVHQLKTMSSDMLTTNFAANTSDEGANGMLFVHRGRGPPEYWSGAILDSLDVAFLSLPTPPEVEIVKEGGYGRIEEARTGLILGSPYQRLDRSYYRTGYGPLDDPGPYSFFLKQSKSNTSRPNGKGDMELVVEGINHLDPFSAVKQQYQEGLQFEGSPSMKLFDGHHDMEDGAGNHRCMPSDKPDFLAVQSKSTPIITAILEVRRGLFQRFTSSFFQNNDVTETEQRDNIQFSLHPSVALLEEMEAKEFLYNDIVTTLDGIIAELLDTCNKPITKNSSRTEDVPKPPPSAPIRPMEAWREGSSAGVSSFSELLDAAPKTKAHSFSGSDGTRRSSDFVKSARYPRSDPSMPTYPPVDIELFAAIFQLGMCNTVVVRVMERIAIDLKHDHKYYQAPRHGATKGASFSETYEPSSSQPRISDAHIRTLASLVRDPSVSVFIPEVVFYTMREAERRGLIV